MSTRQSILAERSRNSKELLNEMKSLSNEKAKIQKNQEWKKAVTEELKLLDEHQGDLAQQQAELLTEQGSLTTLCQQCSDSCATNRENMLKLHNPMKNDARANDGEISLGSIEICASY